MHTSYDYFTHLDDDDSTPEVKVERDTSGDTEWVSIKMGDGALTAFGTPAQLLKILADFSVALGATLAECDENGEIEA